MPCFLSSAKLVRNQVTTAGKTASESAAMLLEQLSKALYSDISLNLYKTVFQNQILNSGSKVANLQ